MGFWYFFTVPALPREVSHQSNTVEIQKYLVREGDKVDIGTPVAVIENYWAVMNLKANGSGLVTKTFFPRGTGVRVGDPIAIISADGESIPYGKPYSVVEIVKAKREKPR
jgi:pyruvate dehydrogenase E2 component (dihydrolipoamide acetyltransferase)